MRSSIQTKTSLIDKSHLKFEHFGRLNNHIWDTFRSKLKQSFKLFFRFKQNQVFN